MKDNKKNWLRWLHDLFSKWSDFQIWPLQDDAIIEWYINQEERLLPTASNLWIYV